VPNFRKYEANSELFNEDLRKSGAIIPLLRPIHPKSDRLLEPDRLLAAAVRIFSMGGLNRSAGDGGECSRFTPLAGHLLALFFSLAVTSLLADDHLVTIGVLSHRGDEATLRAWMPTATYLSETVDSNRFTIKPLSFDQIDKVVEDGGVDFVLANPGLYVTLEVHHGISRIATLNNRHLGVGYNLFGGVLFALADRYDLLRLEQLAGRRLMAVDASSLGGFQVAWPLLEQAGIDPYSDLAALEFAGTHDEVVRAVREGEADVGLVRTDILERMERAGEIQTGEFRVIHPLRHAGFPFVHSTELYPEWPFAKLRHTDKDLAQQVAIALLGMPPSHPAAVAGEYAGWTVPLDYQPVHELFKRYHLGPYANSGLFTLLDVWKRYWYWLLLGLVLVIVLALLLLWVSRLNQALARAKRGLELENALILRSVADGVYGVDLEGRCTFVNPAVERITGWSKADLLGNNQHRLLHHSYADGSPYPDRHCPVFATFRKGIAHYVDNEVFWHKDGSSFPVEYVSSPLRDQDNQVVGSVVVFRDVTARREAEEQLSRHQDEIAHISRATSMGGMASAIAHELNQPLAAIVTYSAAAVRLLKQREDGVLEVLERVTAQAERAGEILRQIRAFIGKGQLERGDVDINQVVGQIVTLLEAEARRRAVRIELDLAEDLPHVEGSAVQLGQVVFNLIRNGMDAMVDTAERLRQVKVTTTVEAEQVVITIADAGHGLSEESMARLFDPFYTTRSAGMGLGLSISRTIIESHGGRLAAMPGAERGAVFQFSLPVHAE
jgi:PAS domain S-box-containing protein